MKPVLKDEVIYDLPRVPENEDLFKSKYENEEESEESTGQ